MVGKTDYAVNIGSNYFEGEGPTSSGCAATFPTCTSWYVNSEEGVSTQAVCALLDGNTNPTGAFNGVSCIMSQVSPGTIVDGLSNVFYAGEKYLDPVYYYDTGSGSSPADDASLLQGNDIDIARYVGGPAMRDTPSVDQYYTFGSAHAQGCHFVFCDGSVRLISYQINFATYQSLGVRNDGTLSEDY